MNTILYVLSLAINLPALTIALVRSDFSLAWHKPFCVDVKETLIVTGSILGYDSLCLSRDELDLVL